MTDWLQQVVLREGETQDNFQVEVWQLRKLCQLVKQEEVPVWSGYTQAERI